MHECNWLPGLCLAYLKSAVADRRLRVRNSVENGGHLTDTGLAVPVPRGRRHRDDAPADGAERGRHLDSAVVIAGFGGDYSSGQERRRKECDGDRLRSRKDSSMQVHIRWTQIDGRLVGSVFKWLYWNYIMNYDRSFIIAIIIFGWVRIRYVVKMGSLNIAKYSLRLRRVQQAQIYFQLNWSVASDGGHLSFCRFVG